MPENTVAIQETRRFKKGRSGNPDGRPKGALNKTTLVARMLLENELTDICKTVVQMAKEGNLQAIKIVLDRVLPPRRDLPVTIQFPSINGSQDLLAAASSVTNAVTSGEISPAEGEAIAKILDTHARVLELSEVEARLKALEDKV